MGRWGDGGMGGWGDGEVLIAIRFGHIARGSRMVESDVKYSSLNQLTTKLLQDLRKSDEITSLRAFIVSKACPFIFICSRSPQGVP